MANQSCFRNSFWQEAPEISNFTELKKIIFHNRGLRTDLEISDFFTPELVKLHNPFLFSQMRKAVDRIFLAIKNKERIMIFGDFDADGITSTTILTVGLRELGAEVSYRIPDRNRDSHGLKTHFIDEFQEENVGLIITCDCGTNDAEEVAYAKKLKIDTIITDHHESDLFRYPKDAIACLNPRIKGETYPEKQLSGSAVAFKLISACAVEVFPTKEVDIFLEKFLEMAAIGVIADCVDLLGENRILAKLGLSKIKGTDWSGLRKLLDRANIDLRNISAETIGFTIGPRINAASRIGDVYIASELFCGDEEKHFERLDYLEEFNLLRQKLTEEAVLKAKSQIREDASSQFFFNKDWIPGVLGLLCSRYVSVFDCPVFAATIREDGLLTASCRASAGFSIIEALNANAELFHKFGGHNGAAGFLADPKNLKEIEEKLNLFFAENNKKEIPVSVDAFLSSDLLKIETMDFLNNFAPFGKGNENPVFGIKNARVYDFQTMGKNKNHGRIFLDFEDEKIELIAFFCTDLLEKIEIGKKYDFLFTMATNFWRGEERIQFRFFDVREG
jgi:single-stranded-DNA-specific exonuclease